MYDIDPPSPILRLVSSTTSDERLRYTINRLHQESLAAPRTANQPTRLSDRQHLARIAQSDPWTVRHSVASGPEAMVFRTCGAVLRLKALAEADADLSGALDAAL